MLDLALELVLELVLEPILELVLKPILDLMWICAGNMLSPTTAARRYFAGWQLGAAASAVS